MRLSGDLHVCHYLFSLPRGAIRRLWFMFVTLSVHLPYNVCILSHCLFCILPPSRLPAVWPRFIRIPEAILGLNGSWGQMEMMEAKLCLSGHQATKVSYSRPQATKKKNGLHTDFLWWRGVERLQSGLKSWNDCFRDADTETKWKTIRFSTLAVFLCRSNLMLIFLVDSSLGIT